MPTRKAPQTRATSRKSASKRQTISVTRQFSAIVGGALIGFALLWAGWLFLRQMNPAMNALVFPLPGPLAQNTTDAQPDPLLAAGVTLSDPPAGQEPLVSKQQAVLLANQLEPSVASRAGGTDSQYTLFSYSNAKETTLTFRDVAAWLIHYSKVSEPHPDTSADPHATGAQHDLYIFLDASTGVTLLTIWL